MTIQGDDFKLEQISNSAIFWDLYLLKTIRPKGCSARQELTLDSYSLTLDYAIRKIISFRLHNKHEEEAITLSEYLREYREGIDKLTELCKSLPKDSDIDIANV